MNRLEITIELDESIIKRTVEQIWSKEMGVSGYRDEERPAHLAIKRQVERYIGEMDLTEMISGIARAKLSPIVDKVVSDAITSAAKRKAAEMVKNGTLFDGATK